MHSSRVSKQETGALRLRLRTDGVVFSKFAVLRAAAHRRSCAPGTRVGSRLSPPRKRSEDETSTDCRSKVAVVQIGDAGAVRDSDGQTAGHEGIRKSSKTIQTLGEVMIRI